MSNFWGAINAIRREATKLRTDVYSAGCFTAQEAAMADDSEPSFIEVQLRAHMNVEKLERLLRAALKLRDE